MSEEKREMYQVSWFSKKKGYGFVKSESGEDIFVHHSDRKRWISILQSRGR